MLVIVIIQKNDEKTTSLSLPFVGKNTKYKISVGNAKIEKLKTWPRSKIISDQGHVLGNTNFSPGKQICVFTHGQCFFLGLNITIVFSK